jgi:hypothetical protein
MIPKKINPYPLIDNNKEINLLQKLNYEFNVKAIRHYLSWIERKKIRYAKKKVKFKNNEKVLLLSYTNHLSDDGKIFRLNNTIKKLEQDDKYTPLVIFADPLSRKSYNQISKLNGIYSYYNKELLEIAKEKAITFSKMWKKLNLDEKHLLLSLKGKDYYSYFKYTFDLYFSKEFLTILFLNYELFKTIIKKENVKTVVVTGLSSIMEKCVMAAAKYQSIPIVHIQHGLGKEQVKPDLISDTKLAVISKHYKEMFADSGINPEQIHVVGPVIFDEIIEFKSKKESQLKNILIAPGAKVSGDKLTKDQYFKNFEKLINEIRSLGDIEINIKPHPRSVSTKDFMRMVEKYEKVNFHKPNVSREHFYKLIQDSFWFKFCFRSNDYWKTNYYYKSPLPQ